MSSNPIRLQLLLHKYIQNNATKAELEEFWSLMAELSDNDLVQLDIQHLWDHTTAYGESAAINWEKAYHLLQQKIDAQKIDYTNKIRTAKRRQYIAASAAAVLIVCISILAWKLTHQHTVNALPTTVIASSGKSKQHVRQTISLPDGTRVTLNENSKLDYPSAFNQSTRDVYLTGEAFFDVQHNAGKPFLVHTGKLVTRVLGTAFNIKAYPADDAVFVTVARGKVQVQSDSTQKTLGILSAGDQLVVNKISIAATYSKTNVEKVLEWNAASLQFDNATVDEASIALSNRFGVVFHFQNEELRHCRFTADFSDNSLKQSLDVICTLINASWQQNKGSDIILIDGKGCK